MDNFFPANAASGKYKININEESVQRDLICIMTRNLSYLKIIQNYEN